MVFFPEFFYFFLAIYEIQIRVYFLVQSFFLLKLIVAVCTGGQLVR